MCLTPIITKNSNNIPVPCGRCPECKARRVSSWSFRLMEEEKHSSSSYFITLTYDNKHVPITARNYSTVSLRDLQTFFKRLRKRNGDIRLKYYAAAEYGSKTFRPHYHVILFNAALGTIQPSWMLGQVHYGEVSEASVGYCLKYISKPSRIPLHRNDDRKGEFATMSKGIGRQYINLKNQKWHYLDIENRQYLNLKDGKKVSMPRYYKDRLYDDESRKKIAEAALRKHIEGLEKFESSTGDTFAAFNENKRNIRTLIERKALQTRKDKI